MIKYTGTDIWYLLKYDFDWDISQSSFFMGIDCSKTGDDKLKFQAPWDFDIPFGIVQSYEAYYYANNLCAPILAIHD